MTMRLAVAKVKKADWSPFAVARWPDESAVPMDSCYSARWEAFLWDSW